MFLAFLIWMGMAAFIAHPSSGQSTAIDGASHTFTVAFGAVVGLLGGKVGTSG